MKASVGSSTTHKDHCEPMHSAMEMPISRMRFQFQQHDLARSVERVRRRDAGEDQTEGPPGSHNVGLHLAGARDGHGRETIETEGDVSAEVAIEPPRDVPQRSAQHQARKQKRQAYQKTKIAEAGEVSFAVDDLGGNAGEHRDQTGNDIRSRR